MPVGPTYPGVYIEEIPSGVQTITGVSTSTTAFIGYTARGPVDDPIHIFSFADFERACGGLALDSRVSHAVKQFFQNGGSDAYVVRTALNAAVASVTARNSASAAVLTISASTAGTWGNALQIDVDYDTANPRSLFNLRATEFLDQNGTMVPGRSEVFRNLTHNPTDSNYVVANVNANSQLITVAVPALVGPGKGTSESGTLTLAEIALLDASHNRLGLILDGGPPF